ncbi:hypothetical protein A6A04_06635 [Paramagnetospirillum marisnigri]|uniref:Uncharacterized protein n=1 Tax=Paramagnetospirillum marisnigri TaxID=1285242 RepID=A0A178M9X7_9PROT|nr:hypothetical protein [Paramagnetospirillum marisnigri]OAN45570.1 hypothetical protein A6A04_06635 [Paramagnetospirillum marisnigri]
MMKSEEELILVAAIERRLAELSSRYPSSIMLAVDNEGRAYLDAALEDRLGEVVLTDNGGGPLTEVHWKTVINHIGFVAVIVWLSDPRDLALVRQACREVEEMHQTNT